MTCLDRTLPSPYLPLLALVLALAGCSDDGLAPPPQDTDVTGVTASASTGTNEGTEGPSDSTGPAEPGPTTTDTADTTGPESDETDTGGPANACESPDDCMVINDCCRCAAAHVDDVFPECPMNCLQPMCDALGLFDPEATCLEGSCQLVPFDCTPDRIVCDAIPPRCSPGTLPGVTPSGDCWSGACVPVEACDSVPGCDACTDGQACVALETQLGPIYECQAMPDECAGVPTCACMPPDTCESPFDLCEEHDGMIVCSCPAC
ncbi:hypothetical protein [Paraliomyxa miuraensis]|uniref:hypothetical protein n=1 Tax=Paraliomyxa miuraensis TaxID=376150 RepID=UPI00224E71EE|nr:hypothetical protein [Paraliomyxa miuraensis]MCX4245148.1 hypothetical protein [Paraliomyxa miuraensis]